MSLFLYMGALSTSFLFSGDNPLFDEITLLIGLCIGVVMIVAVRFSKGSLFEQIAVLTFFFLIFILPRIIAYSFAPEYIAFPFGEIKEAAILNKGLLYVFLGTTLLLLGFFVAEKTSNTHVSKHHILSVDSTRYSVVILLIAYFIPFFSDSFFGFIVNITPYGKMQTDEYNTLVQLIRVFFSVDTAVLLVAALLMTYKRSPRNIIAVLTVFICYIAFTALVGSRVGILRVFIIIFIVLVVLYGNFRFNLFKLVALLLVLAVFGSALYLFATKNRLSIVASYHGEHNDTEQETMEAITSPKTLLNNITTRLAIIDYPIAIITQQGNQEKMEKYMNLTYSIKNIINFLVPGTIYYEAEIMTSRVIGIIYRGAPDVSMYSGYFSEYWTLWGLSYVYYGWTGGLIAIFLIGFFIHIAYSAIIIPFPNLYGFFLRLWFLYFVPMGIYGNMGIDSAFSTMLVMFLQTTMLYYIIQILSILKFRVPSLVKSRI